MKTLSSGRDLEWPGGETMLRTMMNSCPSIFPEARGAPMGRRGEARRAQTYKGARETFGRGFSLIRDVAIPALGSSS